MALIPLWLATKLAFVLGITNIIGIFLVLLSCRCIPGLAMRLTQNQKYMSFYRYHCYYWWFFLGSVAMHAILAIVAFGIPV